MSAESVRRTLSRVPGLRRARMAARFGDTARTAPLTSWGSERGTPIDRWYIERFIRAHAGQIHGRVLEVKSDLYGSAHGAQTVEVVDIDPHNAAATVVGDLCDAVTLPAGRYEAAVVTQTLQFLSNPGAAVAHLVASLVPGGVLLLTVPAVSRLCGPDDLWRWTPNGLQRLLLEAAPGASPEVVGLGNGLAARAFLFGVAAEEIPHTALAVIDDDYPVVVGACLRKSDQ